MVSALVKKALRPGAKGKKKKGEEDGETEQPPQEGQSQPEDESEERGQDATVINEIELANKKLDADFTDDYLRPSEGWTDWTHPITKKAHTLRFTGIGGLSDSELEACFELVDETSGDDYRGSSFGWHPLAKKKEMRSPDLRYILVKDGRDGLRGFVSMMPTFENSEPVVYVYEIHLTRDLLGTGLAQVLMSHTMTVAENIPSVEKTMLTCFTSNARGLKFYGKMGFETDDFSPRERRLRGGRLVTPDYVILSRRTIRSRRRGSEPRGAASR